MSFLVGLVRAAIAAFALIGTQDAWLHGEVGDLVFFTTQSNLLLAVVFLWAAFSSFARKPQPPGWLKGGATLFIVITGLVSYFILDPEAPGNPTVVLGLTSSEIVHQVTPVAAFLDFLLLDPHRRLTIKNAALWLLYPLAYCVFTTVRGVVAPDTAYPYGFIDVSELGYVGLLQNVAIYGVGFFVLGLVVVGIDRALPRRALVSGPGSAVARGGGGRR